jgi:eukaryotic-like serine/threonine-protein kinase
MSGQIWPVTLDYVSAVRAAPSTFHIPQLQAAKFVADGDGPRTLEGQRAVVFFADTDDGPLAVRCLKTPLPAGAERYTALRQYLAQHPVRALIRADWIEDGIQVKGYPWPVMTMERVAGPSLLTFVERNLHDPSRLKQVAADWRTLISELSAANIAHGDLQQDNIMLASERHLRLIDLDAVWIPTLTHLPPPPERGHPNFQHPERTHRGYWGRYVDTFPALVIYISLLALAADPALFDDFNNDENLIFSDEDFLRPGEADLWHRLWASPDLELRSLVSILERYCRTSVQMDTDLDRLLSAGGFPQTALKWESPGIKVVRRAWWAALPPEVAAPAEPTTTATPATAPPAREPAAFTAANLTKDWWQREPAGPPPPARSGQPSGRQRKPQARPSAPARGSGQRVLTYAAVIAFFVLLFIIIALTVGL